MSDERAIPPSRANNSEPYLIAGMAMATPNPDPAAIPIPDSIAFLYNIPRLSIQDLDPEDKRCPICLEDFTNDGRCEVDALRSGPEVPVLTPCGHIIGSRCLYIQLSPFKRNQGNQCCLCRHEFFERQRQSQTPVGMDRAIKVMSLAVQECRRQLTEGPERRK